MLMTTFCFGVCRQQHSQGGIYTCFLLCSISLYGSLHPCISLHPTFEILLRTISDRLC